ncbi:MAG: aminoacyl-tRNA hydrolase [Phycisphaerae bacterium]|nr:aminoacyl-tRNA hydrolase [Phycisphaerae bacterium]
MEADETSHPAESSGATILLAGGPPAVRVRWDQLRISAVRSSGPGGQNVNKVSTKIELRVWLSALGLEHEALARLRRIAGRRVTEQGELVLTESGSRSQSANRDGAIERLRRLVAEALVKPKPRVKTKPTKGSERRRVEGKKRTSETKRLRRKPHDD